MSSGTNLCFVINNNDKISLIMRIVMRLSFFILKEWMEYDEDIAIGALTKICKRYPNYIYDKSYPIFNKIENIGYNKLYETCRQVLQDFLTKEDRFGHEIEEVYNKSTNSCEVKIMDNCLTVSKILYKIDDKKKLDIYHTEFNINDKCQFKFLKIGILMIISEYIEEIDTFQISIEADFTDFCVFCYLLKFGFKFKIPEITTLQNTKLCVFCQYRKLETKFTGKLKLLEVDKITISSNIYKIVENYHNQIISD